MHFLRSISFRMAIILLPLAGLLAAVYAEGVLTVKTDPDGIEVWLGDKFLGQSPIVEKKVKAGRYSLKLVDPTQHTSASEELFLQDGDTTVVERTLTTKFGSLKVTSDPEGAEAFIATELGKTPLTNEFMNPGRYRIEIRPPNANYSPAVSEISITKGQTVSIDQKLVPVAQKDFFTTKKLVSLGLFAGTVGGFVWGLVEQGQTRMYGQQVTDAEALHPQPTTLPDLKSKRDGAALGRTLGIILGSACAVGLELCVLF
jgi:hypothetical protein